MFSRLFNENKKKLSSSHHSWPQHSVCLLLRWLGKQKKNMIERWSRWFYHIFNLDFVNCEKEVLRMHANGKWISQPFCQIERKECYLLRDWTLSLSFFQFSNFQMLRDACLFCFPSLTKSFNRRRCKKKKSKIIIGRKWAKNNLLLIILLSFPLYFCTIDRTIPLYPSWSKISHRVCAGVALEWWILNWTELLQFIHCQSWSSFRVKVKPTW